MKHIYHQSISAPEYRRIINRLEPGDQVSVTTSAEEYDRPLEVVNVDGDEVTLATTYAPVRNRDDYEPSVARPSDRFEDVEVVLDVPGSHPASLTEFAPDP